MLRWASSISVISLAAFTYVVASIPPRPPLQPIQFSHRAHLDYFQDDSQDGHRRSMVSRHEEIFEEYKDGRHGRSMVSRHKEILLKELEDEDIVDEMMGDVEEGYCRTCHRDYDDNVRDLAKLFACAECHRRKEPETEGFVAEMMVDVENGRCTLCHGDFDQNAGENASRLTACAECHRFASHLDWEGREEERPCMGCHNAAFQFPWASIPNTNTCAACHLPPLGDDPEEAELLEFIEQERMISWARVYDYLPGEIVFSHERHVELGRVKCQECHGPVELAERPLALEVKLSMEDCMSCHEATGADNDCLACHK
ncbi:MAG: cytochrome c3 family protein [Planctomycetota bacterium]|jgi:hypothetical protein